MSSNKLSDSGAADKFKQVEGISSKKKLGLASITLMALGGSLYYYSSQE